MVVGKVKFNTLNDVKNFVNIVSKHSMDVDIKYGTADLDGKSIQGLLAIQLQVELNCVLHESLENCSKIIDDIKEYTVSDFK